VEKNVDLGKLHVTLKTVRCTTCHEEHRGLEGLIIREAALCINCHADLANTAPDTGMRNVDGFPDNHPQFRATLVADVYKGTFNRLDLGTKPAPIDHPGLHFSHKAHLVKGGFPPLGYKEMACADCHVAEPGGLGFKPITYDGQCKRCHSLKFERADLPWPDATVPHGDDSVVVSTVWNYYAGKALEGGIADPQAPAVVRRAPGTPLPNTAESQKDLQAWVSERALTTLKTVVLDDKRGCAYCHYGVGRRGTFDTTKFLPTSLKQPAMEKVQITAPVIMLDRFFPKAQFKHASHAASACEDCHDARHSEDSRDVLIPGKETCLGCHGAERASLKSQSTCTTCHVFHHNEFGLMRETTAAASR
jgi:predicted CXXCH cytochrome family protein